MVNQYSRRDKTEQNRNIKKAALFTLLTIVTIVAFIFYGFPAVAKLVLFLTDLRKSSQPVELSDTTPPPSPRFDSTPDATNIRDLLLKGRTESGATVILKVNGREEELLANSDGEFSHDFSLKDGVNTYSAKAKDSSNNIGPETQQFTILFDDKAPDLEIVKPLDATEFYGAKDRQIVIEGITEENSSVRVNGRFVVVENDGSFTFTTTLSEGKNEFITTSEDKAGNKTEKIISVNYTS